MTEGDGEDLEWVEEKWIGQWHLTITGEIFRMVANIIKEKDELRLVKTETGPTEVYQSKWGKARLQMLLQSEWQLKELFRVVFKVPHSRSHYYLG